MDRVNYGDQVTRVVLTDGNNTTARLQVVYTIIEGPQDDSVVLKEVGGNSVLKWERVIQFNLVKGKNNA